MRGSEGGGKGIAGGGGKSKGTTIKSMVVRKHGSWVRTHHLCAGSSIFASNSSRRRLACSRALGTQSRPQPWDCANQIQPGGSWWFLRRTCVCVCASVCVRSVDQENKKPNQTKQTKSLN